MEKNKNVPPKPPEGGMLNQKTNEDFNKRKPDPTDPNEQKKRPNSSFPEIEMEDLYPLEGGRAGENSDQQKPPNKSEGSE